MEWQRLDSDSQVFSTAEYPFRDVRYFRWLFGPLYERIASTSYSSSLSMTSEGGSRKDGPYALVERYGDSKEAWKTLCIFQVCRSFRQ